jgi:hypothetical protein
MKMIIVTLFLFAGFLLLLIINEWFGSGLFLGLSMGSYAILTKEAKHA